MASHKSLGHKLTSQIKKMAKSRRQRLWKMNKLQFENLEARQLMAADCIEFEDLPLGSTTTDLDPAFTTVAPSGGLVAEVTAKPFQWYPSGSPAPGSGFARVDNSGLADGGIDQDMQLNNILLEFDFNSGSTVPGLTVKFGAHGGNINLGWNGFFQNVVAPSAITSGGGVTATVVNTGGSLWQMTLTGNINPRTFQIGGQELWVDEICIHQGENEPRLDYGDAPTVYPVLLASNGGRHYIKPGYHLGAGIDSDSDGQPTLGADGDDTLDTSDDEDGVNFMTPLVPGSPATIEVSATADGRLDAWVDWNRDGSWDPADQIFASQPLVAGINVLNFNVPATAVPDANEPAYARFRFSSTGSLAPDGPAQDGEVEDYAVLIGQTDTTQASDWGDAPDRHSAGFFYPTLALHNGAVHQIDGVTHLGSYVDGDVDGQPSPAANGDDVLDAFDDEDGVTFVTPFVPGGMATVHVDASVDGYLNAWVDFNRNGNWEPGEQVFTGEPLAAGVNVLTFSVPTTSVVGATYSRWRFTSDKLALTPDATGTADGVLHNGEVEDYRNKIRDNGPNEVLDFGDAPDKAYQTLLASNGARHTIRSGYHLGARVDPDRDGQPSLGAIGDDVFDLSDDEDGVRFLTTLVPGRFTRVEVVASADGMLDAWIDFNDDGSWDASEQIFASRPLVAGSNFLSFPVPNSAKPGPNDPTYARFRFSSVGGLTPEGPAGDGEVEDYKVFIQEKLPPIIVVPFDWDWEIAVIPVGQTDSVSIKVTGVAELGYGPMVDEQTGEVTPLYTTSTSYGVVILPYPRCLQLATPPLGRGQTVDTEVISLNLVGQHPDLGVVRVTLRGDSVQNPSVGSMRLTNENGILDAESSLDVLFDITLEDSGQTIGTADPVQVGMSFAANDAIAANDLQLLPTMFWGENLNVDLLAHDPGSLAWGTLVGVHGIPIKMFDWGDAPDKPYPTLSFHGGAMHRIDGVTYLGNSVDADWNGQPTPQADGDDLLDGHDDEDGVTFLTPIVPGGVAKVQVDANVDGFLNAWLDFNIDGSWSPGEQIFSVEPLNAGANVLSFVVPTHAATGETFSRWRFTQEQINLSPERSGVTNGKVLFGEVEDYKNKIIHDQPNDYADYGDAPDEPYPTLAAHNGAVHRVDDIFFLGHSVDADADGQPTIGADGDDSDGNDDGDGVTFVTPLVPGGVATVEVLANMSGHLNAWVDFDGDGTWDPAERIYAAQPLAAGMNVLPFAVPATAKPGETYSRWRFTRDQVLLPPDGTGTSDGSLLGGEVEDYINKIEQGQTSDDLDYGDAPDEPYRTLAANHGAFHRVLDTFFLGHSIDTDPDGQPTADADGDDLLDGNDDEDGVIFVTPLVPGAMAHVEVLASASGYLNAWVDFDANGVWDAAEQIFVAEPLVGGVNVKSFAVPTGAAAGETYSRWRFTREKLALTPNGTGTPGVAGPHIGEVEDYKNEIEEGQPNEYFDYGDAPDEPYPTLSAHHGAVHRIDGVTFLGHSVDGELDGQPTAHADGDDLLDGNDDEDGVIFLTPMIPGSFARVRVHANVDGFLNAWVDFDGDGHWAPGEQIFSAEPVAAGPNVLGFVVPTSAVTGQTFSRWRFTREKLVLGPDGTGTPDGVFHNGEVEDYQNRIKKHDPQNPDCIEFEDLTLGTVYNVADAFFTQCSSGLFSADVMARPFTWGSGDTTTGGYSEVENGGLAGGTGNELEVNNILLDFDFNPDPIPGVSFLFGEYGGNLNLAINGDFHNFANFHDVHGAAIGGTTVYVVNGFGNDMGKVRIVGTVDTVAIGGQELFVDRFCILNADIDGGGTIEPGDIDLLNDHINTDVYMSQNDFNGDGFVDTIDRDILVHDILGTEYGDTDLDGDLDSADITTAIMNFTSAGGAGQTWATGDTDADGDTDVADILQMIINFTGARADTSNRTLVVEDTAETSGENVEQPSVVSTPVLASSLEPTTEADSDYSEVVNHLFEQLGRDDDFDFGSKSDSAAVADEDVLLDTL